MQNCAADLTVDPNGKFEQLEKAIAMSQTSPAHFLNAYLEIRSRAEDIREFLEKELAPADLCDKFSALITQLDRVAASEEQIATLSDNTDSTDLKLERGRIVTELIGNRQNQGWLSLNGWFASLTGTPNLNELRQIWTKASDEAR